tara:strand:+ start:59 stop:472 length:414 start_codon:yes stop_codon:yes gene_type:complete
MATKKKSTNRTNEALYQRIKRQVTAGSKGGKPGQWSARKAQMVTQKYKAKGGGYKGAKNQAQRALTKWAKEEWTTKSGKPSLKTGERYMPKKAIKKLSSSEYAATSRKKRAGMKAGKQFVKNTKAAAKAIKSARKKR